MTETTTDGSTLGGRYDVGDVVGRGGLADVYRGRDRVLDRVVAVKVLRTVHADDVDRARFDDEAKVLASLNHPGLVTLLDADTSDDDHPYLVMELVEGPTLADCCRGVPLPPSRVARLGAQLAETLDYVHSCEVVHRDLKPGNILVSEDDRALLTDFGIARLMAEGARHTATGSTVGTAAYLAPEQVRGETVTPAADVYALGLVLLEALRGEPEYSGVPSEVALVRLSKGPTVPEHLSPGWRELITAMTAHEPDDRPLMTDVADRLERLAEEPDPDPAPGSARHDRTTVALPPLPRSGERHGPPTPRSRTTSEGWAISRIGGRVPMPLLASAFAVVVLVVVLVVISLSGGSPPPTTPVPTNVPSGVQQPLEDLHRAVDGGS
jgi:serine/threonine protein kinase